MANPVFWLTEALVHQMAREGSEYKVGQGPPFDNIEWSPPKIRVRLVTGVKGNWQRRLTTGLPVAISPEY